MLFKKSPLVIWVLCFMIGIIAGVYDYFIFSAVVLLLFIISGVSLFLTPSKRWIKLFFGTSFIVLGTVHMQSIFPNENTRLESADSHFFVAEIEDQLRKGVVWETNVAKLESVKINGVWERMNERVLLICQSSSQFLKKGDKIIVKTEIVPIKNDGNPGEFDSKFYWMSKGIRYQCFGALENYYILHPEELSFAQKNLASVRKYSTDLIEKYITGEEGDLMKSILLGDKSDLEQETKLIFSNTGAMHVLAVSGLNIGIIAYLLSAFMNFLFRGKYKTFALILVIMMLWFYAFVTGFSASITRAVFMFTVLIASQMMNRQYNSLNSLAFAALVIILWNPISIFDIGFQLSFLAMVGIFTLYDATQKLIYVKNKYVLKLWQGTAIGLAAQVFTVPLCIYYFHQFPNYFMIANIGVMLLSGLILGIGIALLVLGKIPYLSMGIGWIAALSVGALMLILQAVDKLPGAVALGFEPNLYWILGMYCLIIAVLGYGQKFSLFSISVIFLPALIWLQFNRFQNLKLDELCVFNSGQIAVLINQAGNQKCFYAGNEVALEDAKQHVKNYQNLHPGNVEFYHLNFKRYDLSSKSRKLAITWFEEYIEVKLKNETIHFIHYQKYDKPVNRKVSYVASSYLDIISDQKHSLANGAFQCAIP